jgi:hypothetical protein
MTFDERMQRIDRGRLGGGDGGIGEGGIVHDGGGGSRVGRPWTGAIGRRAST